MNRHVCLHHMIYLPTFHYLRLILYDVTFQQTSTRIAALHFSLYLFSIEAIHLQILFSGSSLTSPAFYYSLFLRHPILSQKYLALFFECLSGRQQMFIHSSLKVMIVYQRMSLRAYEYTLFTFGISYSIGDTRNMVCYVVRVARLLAWVISWRLITATMIRRTITLNNSNNLKQQRVFISVFNVSKMVIYEKLECLRRKRILYS